MEYIISAVISKISQSTINTILIPVNNVVNPIVNIISTPFKNISMLKLFALTKRKYQLIGDNSYFVVKSNEPGMMCNGEYLGKLFCHLNNVIIMNITMLEDIDEYMMNYDYEFIYSLSDCIINREDYSVDLHMKSDNTEILLMSIVKQYLNDYEFNRFLMRNKEKIIWDIKKALKGIHNNGYVYGKMCWNNVIIHENKFKLIVDKDIQQTINDDNINIDWYEFSIMFGNNLTTHNETLLQLLYQNKDYSILDSLKIFENVKIYISDEREWGFLTESISKEF